MCRCSLVFSFVFATLCSTSASAGIYSGPSGDTPNAIDNPIERKDISIFESRIVDYSPAPGVGSRFRNPATGFGSLGDLYSPLSRATENVPFNKNYAPAPGTKPSSVHAGSGKDKDLFIGNINDPYDTYGFIGIDKPGSITLGFSQGIGNGPGADFAVFENGFALGPKGSLFAEFAYVEVSSNGDDFVRFPSISLNTAATATMGTMQAYDVTNVYNLAGKHASNWGTPFDLDDLLTIGQPLIAEKLLDLNSINFVRLVDVVGSGELLGEDGNLIPGIARDSLGNAILDNWLTYDSGGFDYLGLKLGAIGVLNISAVPEPSSLAILGVVAAAVVCRRRRKRTSVSTNHSRRKMNLSFLTVSFVLTTCLVSGGGDVVAHAELIADFEDIQLGQAGYLRGPFDDDTIVAGPYGKVSVGKIRSQGVDFISRSDVTYGSWSGFAVSNKSDTTTPGFTNQFSAYTGSGWGGTGNYGIAFGYRDTSPSSAEELYGLPTILLPAGMNPFSMKVTNTTYAALSMIESDGFAKNFGGESGNDPDWFKLSIFGIDANERVLSDHIDFMLADYTFADNSLDYILSDWAEIDLSGLAGASSLHFNVSSSDASAYGMNTPGYFAMDNLRLVAAVPEPSSIALVACVGLGLICRRRRQRLMVAI